jgi:5-(carboxyamino)imidazole ribonucleotide synthase
VGVVGAGQLALMMGEAARELPLELVVLAEHPDDPAVAVAAVTLPGSGREADALAALASAADVVTLDHELVDLVAWRALGDAGVAVHPTADALRYAADKAVQREAFARAGLPVPRFAVVTDVAAADAFAATLPTWPVLKAPTGGYDGRGVWIEETEGPWRAALQQLLASGPVLLEERLTLLGEAAIQIVVATDGSRVLYPIVDTVQRDGMCVETAHPTSFPSWLVREAEDLTQRIADLVEPVGVMAVEFFHTPDGLVVNEIALRPHNTGHWTIEGCATSQFANHLRAVAGLPLGPTDPVAAAVMVNVVGGDDPLRTSAPGTAHFHDYHKAWRPGRKLGHVTATGATVADARVQAWAVAEALGSGTRGMP